MTQPPQSNIASTQQILVRIVRRGKAAVLYRSDDGWLHAYTAGSSYAEQPDMKYLATFREPVSRLTLRKLGEKP